MTTGSRGSVPSPARLKQNSGAANVGTSTGVTVENRFVNTEAAEALNQTRISNFANERAVPHADFSWLTILPTVNGVKRVYPSESVSSYAERVHSALIGTGEIWVDPVNGSDAAVGTIAAPVKTIEYACRTLAASRIYLMGSNDVNNPALFDKFQFRSTDTPGNKIKIIEALGHCRIEETTATIDAPVTSDAFDSVTWTANATYPNVYEFTRTNAFVARAVLWETIREDNGRAKRLPLQTSILNVNNSGFGWYDDGTKVYVRIQSQNIETIKSTLRGVFATAGTSRVLIYGAKILLKAGEGSSMVFAGVNLQPLYLAPNRGYLYAHGNIRVEYSQDHGLDALGADTYCQDVEIFASKGDNFHYTDSTVECRGLEVDCKVTYGGDYATYGSAAAGTDNGSAMHGTGFIARFGGDYSLNYGPDVVDSGTGKYWNVGTKAHKSENAANGSSFHVTGGTMYLDSCHGSDGEYDLRVDLGATMTVYNSIYRTSLNNGTLNTYSPIE